jgi:hypothetical protein
VTDPITTAIIAAISIGVVSGATKGATKVAEQAIVDAYNGLKMLFVRKFGQNSEVVKAVERLEEKPDSSGRRTTLSEEVELAKAIEDKEILGAANNLFTMIKQLPAGEQHIQAASGSYIAQADRGSTASVVVDKKD